jgi:hypothetical protein
MSAPRQLERTSGSIARGVGTLLALLGGVSVVGYWFEGFARHQWWSESYIASLSIPFSIAIVVQYLWFVPKRLAWDEAHLEIDTWLGGNFRAPWSELRHWGNPGLVFTLECGSLFGGGKSFQIALNYFTPESVAALRGFLSDNFSDRRASFWIGRHGTG